MGGAVDQCSVTLILINPSYQSIIVLVKQEITSVNKKATAAAADIMKRAIAGSLFLSYLLDGCIIPSCLSASTAAVPSRPFALVSG